MASCLIYESINNWKFINEELKASAISISSGYLSLADSTHLQVYCITKSQYLTLLHSKDVEGIELVEINKLDNLLAVITHEDSQSSIYNVVVYDIQSGETRYVTMLPEKITTIFWMGFSLYLGTISGKVFECCISMDEEGYSDNKLILSLDSSIVQFDASESESILGISTQTRAFIYNMQDKTLKEVGSKLRQGNQGIAVGLGRVWAARPGCRIWEVEILTAYVAATRQYRRVISEQGSQKIQSFSRTRHSSGYRNGRRSATRERSLTARDRSSASSDASSTCSSSGGQGHEATGWQDGAGPSSLDSAQMLQNGDSFSKISEHGFSLLRKSSTTLVSFSEDGAVYLMDIHSSKLLAWISISAKIKDVRVDKNMMLVLDINGNIHHFTFGSLDIVMKAAYNIQQFDYCGEIFVANRKQIRSLDKEELKEIISMKDLSTRMRESSKSLKVYKLMDAVERLCITLDGRRYENRSVSQDRHDRLYPGRNSSVNDDLIGGKSHSQEDLLDSGDRRRQALITGKLSLSSKELTLTGVRKLSMASAVSGRHLSADSSRELSASEQGLQALQLYKIKQSARDTLTRDEGSLYSLTSTADLSPTESMHKSMDALILGLEEKARSAGLEIDANNKDTIEETIQDQDNTEVINNSDQEKIKEKPSSRDDNGTSLLSKRIVKELKSAELDSRMGRLATIASKLINSLELRNAHCKSFANEFVSIYLDFKKAANNKESEEEGLIETPDLSSCLDHQQRRNLNLALVVILSDPKLLKLFVCPVWEMMQQDLEEIQNHNLAVHQNLTLVFEEEVVREDMVLAKTLECFSGLLDIDRLLECLNVTHYYTLHYLISLDCKRSPTLSPVMLEEVTEENIYNCSNFISTYKGFSVLHLVRYIVEIQKINFECSLHVIQNQVLSMPPICVFYICLQCYSFLNSITSENSRTGDLDGQIQAEWSTFMARAMAVHVPGWPREWQQVMKQHPNFFHFIKNTFKSANLHFLGKQSAIKGSHKSLELLELNPLNNLLMEVEGVDSSPVKQLGWAKTFSFMPALVRCLLLNKELSMPELPLLVELGDPELLYDVGLTSEENCDTTVQHILQVYKQDECPLVWSELAKFLRKSCSPDKTFQLLIRLAVLIKPGDLPQSLYAELITDQLRARNG